MPVAATSNKERVAVFDPSGTAVDEGTRIAVREIISSTIVNSGKYNIVERSMLEKVMEEQAFSNSGAVDDSQATEIGRLTGASKVLVSILTKTGGQSLLSIKLIDVMTANIERQKVQVVAPNDLLNVIESITLDLINATNQGGAIKISDSVANSFENSTHATDPIPGKDELLFYLPSGYQPKKEKDKELPIQVIFNKEYVGGGTLGEGFVIRVPNPGPGVYKIIFGGRQVYKIDTNKYNYFKFQPFRWSYLGKSMYNLNLIEMKMIQ